MNDSRGSDSPSGQNDLAKMSPLPISSQINSQLREKLIHRFQTFLGGCSVDWIMYNLPTPLMGDDVTEDELVSRVRILLENLNTMAHQMSAKEKELQDRRQQLPLQLEEAREQGKAMGARMKQEQHEKILQKLIDENPELAIKIRKLREEFREDPRVARECRTNGKDTNSSAVENWREKHLYGNLKNPMKSVPINLSTLSPLARKQVYDYPGREDEYDQIIGNAAIKQSPSDVYKMIRGLRDPSSSIVPREMKSFPIKFVQKFIGGNYSLVTSTNCASNPPVDWKLQVHVDPEFHKRCPTRRKNGMLSHIIGSPSAVRKGETYAVWRQESPMTTKYIGHYTVVKRILQPFNMWDQDFSETGKEKIVNHLVNSAWGRDLLLFRGFDDRKVRLHEKKVAMITKMFQNQYEPSLRMYWSVLQYETFDIAGYQAARYALYAWEPSNDVEEFIANQRAIAGQTAPAAVQMPSNNGNSTRSRGKTSTKKRSKSAEENSILDNNTPAPTKAWTSQGSRVAQALEPEALEENPNGRGQCAKRLKVWKNTDKGERAEE